MTEVLGKKNFPGRRTMRIRTHDIAERTSLLKKSTAGSGSKTTTHAREIIPNHLYHFPRRSIASRSLTIIAPKRDLIDHPLNQLIEPSAKCHSSPPPSPF
jgi:hypothetical protein